jgi:sec-independent protein translocase protein TatA
MGKSQIISQFAILGIGTSELLIILTAIVLLFGAKRLPELARSVGQSVQELKKSASSAGQIKQYKDNCTEFHFSQLKGFISLLVTVRVESHHWRHYM